MTDLAISVAELQHLWNASYLGGVQDTSPDPSFQITTIEKSEQEDRSKYADPGYPILMPYQISQDEMVNLQLQLAILSQQGNITTQSDAVKAHFMATEHEVVIAILDAWAASNKEIAKLVEQADKKSFQEFVERYLQMLREEGESDEIKLDLIMNAAKIFALSNGLFLPEGVANLTASTIASLISAVHIDLSQKILQELKLIANDLAQRTKDPSFEKYSQFLDGISSAIAQLTFEERKEIPLVLTLMLITPFGKVPIGTAPSSDNTSQGTITFVQQDPLNQIFHDDFAAWAGYVGSLLLANVQLTSVVPITSSVSLSEAQMHAKNETKFIENVLAMVQGEGPLMQVLYSAISTQLAEKMNDQQVNQEFNKLKCIFCAIALAMVYKSETGHITPEEFRALLEGKTSIRPQGLQIVLAKTMSELLEALPPSEREQLLEGLALLMGPNVELDRFIDPSNAFNAFNLVASVGHKQAV